MANQQKDECCPKFDPALWEGKVLEWQDKKFIQEKVRTILYMPLNFGSVMKKLSCIIEKSGATMTDAMCLSEHASKWSMNLFCAVDKEIKGVKNTVLSGKFLCKVYEGPFQDTGKWCKDFEAYAKEKGFTMKKMYMWYTTCPKCAKKYGKNYVVLIAQIE